jgi:hypothetical protein
LGFSSGSVYPQSSQNSLIGLGVRCVKN